MTRKEILDALRYHCSVTYFHYYAPLNYIAYNEALEAADQILETDLVVKRTKQLIKRLDTCCQRYELMMKRNMGEETRITLCFNFLSQEYRGAEKKLKAIRNAIRKVVKNNGFPEEHHEMLTQLYLAVLLCKQACVVHDEYFEEWKKRIKHDFSKDFDERLSGAASIIMELEDCVTKQLGINGMFSYRQEGILRAYTDYMSYIQSEEKQGKAAAAALKQTPSVIYEPNNK